MKRKIMTLLLAVSLGMCGCSGGDNRELTQSGAVSKVADADTAAAVIDGEEISLREWNFYVRMNQMQWEKDYLESYGDDMWSRQVDEDGTTMADSLKEQVLETVCRTHLINQHAGEYEAALSEEAKGQLRERAGQFMEAYHEALLEYAGADEEFVYEMLCENELSGLTAEAAVADYTPDIPEEKIHREGICYVLISTTGIRDEEGNMTPFTEEEVARRTEAAQELCRKARESGNLKEAAEAEGMTPIESSMGASNEGDGQEPLMLDAARLLDVGEISDPIETEEGWFLVQHTSDYDEEGTEYWREYLTGLAREEKFAELLEEWEQAARIQLHQEVLELVDVKIVLKELL
ncbi:MAG: hypothetical protein KH452_07355 [Clostridiales bacterium]|nr:hypothetical protein [Clostridiales bacterium]